MAGIRRPNGTSQRSVVDVRAGEILVGTARRRTPLALLMRAGAIGAIRVLSGRAQLEEAHLADFHARPQLHRQRRHIRQLKRNMPLETGVNEARSRMGENPQSDQ